MKQQLDAARHLLDTENASDEHLLAGIALLSKIQPPPSQEDMFSVLRPHLRFFARLISTHNNRIQKNDKSCHGYLSLALNVLRYTLSGEGLRHQQIVDEVCHMTPLLVEATWLSCRDGRGGKVDDNSDHANNLIELLKKFLANSATDVLRLQKSGLLLHPPPEESHSRNYFFSAPMLQLMELACAAPFIDSLLQNTLRCTISTLNYVVDSAQSHGTGSLRGSSNEWKHVQSLISSSCKFSSYGSGKEFELERGLALHLIASLLQLRGIEFFTDVTWSKNAIIWLQVASGELTILLGRVLTLVETNTDSDNEDSLDKKKLVQWICDCERIFLSSLQYLAEVATAIEDDATITVDWDNLLRIRSSLESGMNSVFQFLTQSAPNQSQHDGSEDIYLEQDVAVSCIRCVGAWFSETYDFQEACPNNDLNQEKLSLDAAQCSLIFCKRQHILDSSKSMREFNFDSQALLTSLLPGIVAIIRYHPPSVVCEVRRKRNKTLTTCIAGMYDILFDFIIEMLDEYECKRRDLQGTIMFQWLEILIDECGNDFCIECRCNRCSKYALRQVPKIQNSISS